MSVASEITRRAKSNLAFALNILPRERRDDMVIFYAFCRSMDDLADDPAIPMAQRAVELVRWKRGIISGFESPTEFETEVTAMRDRREIPADLLVAIIEGCEMDLERQRFETWEDLSRYTWKVACAVGLVSVRLFGCSHPDAEKYAVSLGHALQLTNILRDIGEDLANGGRIYVPMADLRNFGLSEQDLSEGVMDARFHDFMKYEADRAEGFFREAESILPAADRSALVPAIIMAETYRNLLRIMRNDGFKVLKKRYRVSKARKLAILSKHLIARRAGVE